MGATSVDYKKTVNLPRTDFPMKANLQTVEPEWLERMRTTRVVAYRMPEQPFVENEDRFWISAEAVEPVELVELGDLVRRHEEACIPLHAEASLLGVWDEVIASTLGFSGIRLRNARMPG